MWWHLVVIIVSQRWTLQCSTKTMREDGGFEAIKKAVGNLALRHKEHISAYGEGNERRLTGKHETANINTFSWVCPKNPVPSKIVGCCSIRASATKNILSDPLPLSLLIGRVLPTVVARSAWDGRLRGRAKVCSYLFSRIYRGPCWYSSPDWYLIRIFFLFLQSRILGRSPPSVQHGPIRGDFTAGGDDDPVGADGGIGCRPEGAVGGLILDWEAQGRRRRSASQSPPSLLFHRLSSLLRPVCYFLRMRSKNEGKRRSLDWPVQNGNGKPWPSLIGSSFSCRPPRSSARLSLLFKPRFGSWCAVAWNDDGAGEMLAPVPPLGRMSWDSFPPKSGCRDGLLFQAKKFQADLAGEGIVGRQLVIWCAGEMAQQRARSRRKGTHPVRRL